MPLSPELQAYQWALPENLEVPPDEIQARLDFYHDSIILYLLEERGVITTRMVSARDIALAFLREIPLHSGVLPEGALWWRQGRDGPEVALWRPPQIWQAALVLEAFQPPRRFKLPMPGLIFICVPGRPPAVYATKKRPTRMNDQVFHAPLFNIFHDGRSCPGTHQYPQDITEIPQSFFTAFFSPGAFIQGRSREYPNDLLKLWEELDGKKRYPLGDLVPFGIVGDLMK
ncbi:MAG: hypothetical protein HYX85_00280 [Chloroflexi bacterium]|nr:hypothetical protein [Chloroflexota bacterium]